MSYAVVFQSGSSQAIRLPVDIRINSDRVEIFRRGEEIIMREVPRSAARIFDILASFPEDFLETGRDDSPPLDRTVSFEELFVSFDM